MQELIDLINSHRYLYLTMIEELEHNSLRMVLTASRYGEVETDPEIAEDASQSEKAIARLKKRSRPIIFDELCAQYEIEFDHYIAYTVLNEGNAFGVEEQSFSGRTFRIYSKSHFLVYLAKVAIVWEWEAETAIHYGICCSDHVVDIISDKKPQITLLRKGK